MPTFFSEPIHLDLQNVSPYPWSVHVAAGGTNRLTHKLPEAHQALEALVLVTRATVVVVKAILVILLLLLLGAVLRVIPVIALIVLVVFVALVVLVVFFYDCCACGSYDFSSCCGGCGRYGCLVFVVVVVVVPVVAAVVLLLLFLLIVVAVPVLILVVVVVVGSDVGFRRIRNVPKTPLFTLFYASKGSFD